MWDKYYDFTNLGLSHIFHVTVAHVVHVGPCELTGHFCLRFKK